LLLIKNTCQLKQSSDEGDLLPPLFKRGDGCVNTRERILKAAQEAFAKKGFNGVSMEEIAKAAGVKKALIYYYFPSKENLFEEVWTRTIDEIEESLFKEVENEKSYMRKLKKFLRSYIDFVTNKTVLMELIEKEGSSIVEEEKWENLRRKYDGFLSKMASIIAEGKRYNAIYDDIDPVAAANLISSSITPGKKGMLNNILSMIIRGILKEN